MPEWSLEQARTLLAAVEAGTLDAAARRLHVTPSAVSQRVKALEQRTGRVLLVRSTPLRLTESGEVVVRFARQVAQLERQVGTDLGLAEAAGPATLSIAVNADSLATWFLPALTAVSAGLPVRFDLRREDQDHTTRLLRDGRVMAAVTSSPRPVQGCEVRRLGTTRYHAMAAPEFAARRLPPGSPLAAIADATVVVFDRADDLQDRFARLVAGRDCGPDRHHVPSSEGFVEAVVAGLGWGMLPEAQAGSRRTAGTLVDLAPDRPVDVPMYWQQWKLDSPALAAVAEAVARAFEAAHPAPAPPPGSARRRAGAAATGTARARRGPAAPA